jgi:hypothetical protein
MSRDFFGSESEDSRNAAAEVPESVYEGPPHGLCLTVVDQVRRLVRYETTRKDQIVPIMESAESPPNSKNRRKLAFYAR